MDVSTCLSLPPYSFLTAGKLLAAAMASNEVRSVYEERYSCRRSRVRKRILTDIVLLTTSAAYGRNAPQYKGLSYGQDPLFHFLGFSQGYSTFQIRGKLYRELKSYLLSKKERACATIDGGANAKLRMLRIVARRLRIPEERLVHSGHTRAVFGAPLAEDWREFLQGRGRNPRPLDLSLTSLTDRWKETWLRKRLGNCLVLDAVRGFTPCHARISNALAKVSDAEGAANDRISSRV
jgi:hypothetical protein